jgi:virginiamycin B lyase
VTRIDPKTNKVVAVVNVGSKHCSGLAARFGSLWVPNCGDQTLARVDLKTGNFTVTIPTGIADSEGGVATGAGSVWLITDKQGTLVKIDPDTNKVVAEIRLPAGSFALAFGEKALWATCTTQNLLTRVNPETNLIVESIPVGKEFRFLAVGDGFVWTLNQADGSVSKVDVKTNKVVATIEVGVPGPGAISLLGWTVFGSLRLSFPFRVLTRGRTRWSSSLLEKVGMQLGRGYGRCGCLIWLRGLFGGLILSGLRHYCTVIEWLKLVFHDPYSRIRLTTW